MFILDLDNTIINHPVHIMDRDNNVSPSALIPFCEFGGNMSSMGIKIDQFEWPVCNSFQAKILNDQLCYQVDLNRYSNMNNRVRELESGFAFIMDFNKDRQVSFFKEFKNGTEEGLVNWISESNHDESAFIYLDTIGNYFQHKK